MATARVSSSLTELTHSVFKIRKDMGDHADWLPQNLKNVLCT